MDIGAWHCHGSVENGKYYYMDATVAYRQACLKAIKPVALRDGRLPVRFVTAPATCFW